jgi:hypothetical protein
VGQLAQSISPSKLTHPSRGYPASLQQPPKFTPCSTYPRLEAGPVHAHRLCVVVQEAKRRHIAQRTQCGGKCGQATRRGVVQRRGPHAAHAVEQPVHQSMRRVQRQARKGRDEVADLRRSSQGTGTLRHACSPSCCSSFMHSPFVSVCLSACHLQLPVTSISLPILPLAPPSLPDGSQ